MKYLIEYRNKWGDMIRQASTAGDDAGAFAEADTVAADTTGSSKNDIIGVYRQIERPAPAVAEDAPGTFEPPAPDPSDA